MKPKTKDLEVVIKDSPIIIRLKDLSPGDIFQINDSSLLYMVIKSAGRTIRSDVSDTICLNSGYLQYIEDDTIVTLYNAKIELTRAYL